MSSEELKTDQNTKDKLVKEGEKDNKKQTFQILNNIKALLDNNIQEDNVKAGTLEQSETLPNANSEEASGAENAAPIVRAATTTTTTTTSTTTTTRTTTTVATTTPATFVGQLVNGLSDGVRGGIGRLAANVLTGAGFAAAAASPLWAPLLVGKKRRRRDVIANEAAYDLNNDIIQYKDRVLKKFDE